MGRRGEVARALRRGLGSPHLVVGVLLVGGTLAAAALAPLLAPMDPLAQDLAGRLTPPQGLRAPGGGLNASYVLGSDELGRDLLSRILYGARASLMVGFFATGLSLVVGAACGAVAGYAGGRTDGVLMRMMDVLLAMPAVLLAIAIVAALGPSAFNAMVAIALVRIPVMARVVRSDVLQVKTLAYVEAARALGLSHARVLARHILPNAWAPSLVVATLGVGTAIVTEASLSFLGLGAQPPEISWGRMLSAGLGVLRTDPHVTLYPGLAIFVTVLGFNLLGDGLRDVLDVKTRDQ